ncbi:MAG: trehalose-6-phosphate synthase [Phycisphaerales bacterium]|nr:trehalose-6-phosphate synthase [Phycisphaerales bacterium]
MAATSHTLSSKSIRFGLLIAVLAAAATGAIFWFQISAEQQQGLEDLTRRAQLLGHRVTPTARRAFDADESRVPTVVGDRLEGHLRLLGMSLHRADGTMIACGQGLTDLAAAVAPAARQAVDTGADASTLHRDGGGSTHMLVQPVRDDTGAAIGAVAVFHDALYLEDRTTRGILRGMLWSGGVGLAMFLVATVLSWAIFERPLHRLAEWMRRLRFGSGPELPPHGLPVGRLADETAHLAASFRAARSQEREDAQAVVRSERAWTRDRLRAHAIDALGGRPLVVVSNREPYMHQLREGRPALVRPASGLVTGLDPVLRATGGIWVAHGAGDADRQTADAAGCIPVPPEDSRYTLKRVWISREEEQGYYYGFSNEGLWPLCHLTHERPVFRSGDWAQYVRANQRFADAVLDEVGDEHAVVMVQDYQLALVPGMLKARHPGMRVGLFWHIPWPNAEAFRICPYRAELLHGMLGADLVGFHLQQHCNNFLDSVDRMVEARLDWDRFSAELKGHTALVRPFPISVQPWSERSVASGDALGRQITTLREQHQLGPCEIGVGVDRIDYTKGIAERFRAIDRLFEAHPEHIGRFSFVQLGAPSRVHIPRYRDLITELETLADEINWKHRDASAPGWKPIHFLVAHHEGPAVYAFLRMARVCVVSSLHDGMNLVAKEFIAAKAEAGDTDSDEHEGVLVLSEFAGAARDLPEALIINPYDTEQFASVIHDALVMEPRERRQRMTRMRLRVEEFNIYRWAADFLTSLAQASGNPADAADSRSGAAPVSPAPGSGRTS